MDLIETDFQELRNILDAELQKPESLSQAGIVKRYLSIILEYLDQGLLWEVILRTLNEKGVTLNLRSFQQTVYRLKKRNANALAAPSARVVEGGKQRVAGAHKPSSDGVITSNNLEAITPQAPISESNTSSPATISGWALEKEDALMPTDVLEKAFIEIDGEVYDVRLGSPEKFGTGQEAARDKVNASSPNWAEYTERNNKRIDFERARRNWRAIFKKWFISQGYADTT